MSSVLEAQTGVDLSAPPRDMRYQELGAADPVNTAAGGQDGKQGWVGETGASLQLLIPVTVLLLISAAVVFWLFSQGNASLNRLALSVTQGIMQAERLQAGANAALHGDSDGTPRLAPVRISLRSTVDSLGTPLVADISSPGMLESLQSVSKNWLSADAAAGLLLDSQLLLASNRSARELIVAGSGAMMTSSRALMESAARGRNPVRDGGRAGELALLTQRLGAEAALFLDPDSANFGSAGRLQRTRDALMPALAAVIESQPDAKAETGAIQGQLDLFDKPLNAVVADAESLPKLRQAHQTISADVTAMGAALEQVSKEIPVRMAGRSWMTLAASALGILAALSGLAVSRVYLQMSDARAVQAERQRAVAEELEAEAKRTNELNQAAILRLMNELQEVADGDLTVQATVSEDITGAIADSVNYTIEELRSLVSRINSTAEQVNGASSRAQMTAAGLLAATEQQSREIKDTGEAVLAMARRINDVSASASESVEVARQSLTASEGGSKAVNHAISGMNLIRDQIQETAKRIKRLGESSQEIGEIVELISDLTEQTNVLALNAAIQAASAGEAGRGFTIVAEEVQRLAERSAEATRQISMLIKTIQTDTQDAVAAMERSTQGVVDGTRRSDEAGRALESIGTVSVHLAELIESFSQTTSRQAASAGSVAQSIQRILLVNEQTSKGTSQTANSIGRLSELAQELKNSVSRFKVV